MKTRNLLLLILCINVLLGCTENKPNTKKSNNLLLAQANGEIGEIVTVIDSVQWEGKVGKVLQNTLQKPVVALPQDESQFVLRKVNPLRVNNVLKKAKNLLYVISLDDPSKESKALRRLIAKETLNNIYNDTSKYIIVLRDQFARGQIVVFLFAKNKDLLAKKIAEKEEYIKNIFEREEQERLKKKLFVSRSKEIEETISGSHGYGIKIPYGYDLAKNLQNFVWIRQLDPKVEKNFFIYEENYSTQYQLDRISDLREEITSTYLRDGEKPKIYITQQSILPMLTDTITFKKKFALRNRGLWKISDSSGGGPYISYVFVDEKQGKLFYIEGYVYAPGEDKKNLMRELDAVLSTFTLPSE